ATDGALEGTARLATSRGTIHYAVAGNRQTLTHDSGMVTIAVGSAGVQTSMGVILENTGSAASTFAEVAGSLDLPSFHPLSDSLLPQRMDGTLRMMVSDLSAIEAIYPQVVSIGGSLAADLTIGGTVREPLVLGEATLRNGSADIPTLGLELRNAEWTAVGQGVDGISLTGSVESGTGRVEMTGTMKANAESDSILKLRLFGERLLAVNTPEVQLWASPDLNIVVGKREVSVDGDVTIPRALIDLPEIPALAVRASRDAVIVSDTTRGSVSVFDTRARLRVLLGDSVSFRGFGFAGRPTGNLLVIDIPGQATVATGQLTIAEGRYRAYGQDLTIEAGRAIFAGGPVDNPGLDVRATRRARDDDVVAGLEVKGTLKAPEITVFSEPPMLQSEALAYLVLGRPLSELTSSEGNRVTNAAMSLGIRGGNLLAQRVARRFGLDDAGIETEGSWEQASLYAGKYLSPKLYVSYGYGLFEAASLFSARYMLSRRWTLQAETGERTSTDIKFRIERGR
ncbi:translocation/assembly module TamB domain-containing protein, partial [Gemmatimonadota bacterium]